MDLCTEDAEALAAELRAQADPGVLISALEARGLPELLALLGARLGESMVPMHALLPYTEVGLLRCDWVCVLNMYWIGVIGMQLSCVPGIDTCTHYGYCCWVIDPPPKIAQPCLPTGSPARCTAPRRIGRARDVHGCRHSCSRSRASIVDGARAAIHCGGRAMAGHRSRRVRLVATGRTQQLLSDAIPLLLRRCLVISNYIYTYI